MARRTTPQGVVYGYGATAEEADADLSRKLDASAPPAPGSWTLHDVATRIWQPGLARVTPATQRRYTDAYRLHIGPLIGALPLEALTPALLQQWVDRLGVKLGPKSLAMCRAVLTQVLRIAVRDGHLASNPASYIKLPPMPERRERVMAPSQAAEVLAAAAGTPLSAPVFLALVLGLRRGEVCGLRWEDLDRQRGELHVRRQRRNTDPGKTACEDAPLKTRSSRRTLRLPPQLIAEIDARGDLDCDYICCYEGEPWNPERLTKVWDRWPSAPDGWTYHDLRHGAAGLLFALTQNIAVVAMILGHRVESMSWHYTAVRADASAGALEQLAGALFPVDK